MILPTDLNDIINNPANLAVFLALAAWSLAWKGVALWRAAQNGSKKWFIVLLLLNTLGILEIVYIFYFSKLKADNAKPL